MMQPHEHGCLRALWWKRQVDHLVLIRLSKSAMDGLDRSISYGNIGVLCAINVIVIATSLLLFPYLWRD